MEKHVISAEVNGLVISMEIPQEMWNNLEGVLQCPSGMFYSTEDMHIVMTKMLEGMAHHFMFGLQDPQHMGLTTITLIEHMRDASRDIKEHRDNAIRAGFSSN